MENQSTRNISLDLVKIIAALTVIMIHVSSGFVTTHDANSSDFFWGNILDSISRIGVPLFVMISGALILDENKEFSMLKLFQKIKSILFLFIFWSAFYVLAEGIIYPLSIGNSLDILSLIISFIEGYYHMWYLYMLIGLYLITPFLRSFVNRNNKNFVLLFIAIALLTQFTPPIINGLAAIWKPVKYLDSFIAQFYLKFFGGYTAYYLSGWYIVHIGFSTKRKNIFLYAAGIGSLLLTILYVYLTHDLSNGYSNVNIFIYLYTTGVFTMIVNLPLAKYNTQTNLITNIATLSFGVYIIHPLLLAIYERTIPYTTQPLLYMLSSFIIVSIGALVISYFISRVPILKKTIRL